MAWSLERLFASGAQHSVTSLLGTGEASFSDVVSALTRRFGPEAVADTQAVAQLREEVIASTNAANDIGMLSQPNHLSYGRNPSLQQRYQYTVLARLPDANNTNLTIEIPWTINTNSPLTNEEILRQAEEDLNAGYVRPDRYMAAIYADLHRRDLAFQRRVTDQYGGEAPIDIQVTGAYRRE